MQLLVEPSPILRIRCRDDFVVTMRDVMQMFGIVQDKKALGLAAPQVGIDARFFVTFWTHIFVNPRIVQVSDPIESIEGCLSLPGYTGTVSRWNKIRLADGSTWEGQQAIVIQHECDHLNSILISDFRE